MKKGFGHHMNWSLILNFLAIAIGVLLLAGDFSAMNIATLDIARDFSVTGTYLQWVINAYMFAFFVTIVIAGRLADLFGRKKMFLFGLTWFALSSLWGSLTNDIVQLITARALQGVGAAFLWPSIIGLSFNSVPEEKKSFAMGLLLGAAAFGQAIGPLVGGVLTQLLGWRAILWINVPFCLFAGIIALFFLYPSQSSSSNKKVDIVGMLLLALGLLLFITAMERSVHWNFFSWQVLGVLVISLAVLAVFLFFEHKVSVALVPPSLLKNQPFWMACLVIALISPALFANLLYLPFYMQKFLYFSPFEAALGSIPMLLVWALVSPVAGDLYHYLGAKMIIFIATSSVAVGSILLGVVGMQSDYYFLLPGMIITGIGYGFGFSSITTAAVSAVDDQKTSVAGGILYMLQIAGGALGLSIATGLFLLLGKWFIQKKVSTVLEKFSMKQQGLFDNFLMNTSSIKSLLVHFPIGIHEKLEFFLHQAFARAFFFNMLFTAVLAAIGALVTLFFIKKRPEHIDC